MNFVAGGFLRHSAGRNEIRGFFTSVQISVWSTTKNLFKPEFCHIGLPDVPRDHRFCFDSTTLTSDCTTTSTFVFAYCSAIRFHVEFTMM